MRFLLVEAAQATVRNVPEWRSKYFHLSYGADEKRRRWRWRAGWRFVCTGCGVGDGITNR